MNCISNQRNLSIKNTLKKKKKKWVEGKDLFEWKVPSGKVPAIQNGAVLECPCDCC